MDAKFTSFQKASSPRLQKIMRRSPHKIERQTAYGELVRRNQIHNHRRG